MKREFKFSSTIFQRGVRLFACCLLANCIGLHAQYKVTQTSGTPQPGATPAFRTGNSGLVTLGTPPPDGTNTFRTSGAGGEFGLAINGIDIGETLLKTFDVNQDGVASLAELKQVASACVKLWDANKDGGLSREELSSGLKQLFPATPGGRAQVGGARVANGVAVPVSADELLTPDKQVTKNILALADSNKDGLLSLQEINDFLEKSFTQWDQDRNGSLDVQEFDKVFDLLAKPD